MTPVKKRSSMSSYNVPKVSVAEELSEGSFYKIYSTEKNTILRVAKRNITDKVEIEILKIVKHPHINRMLRWWIDEGFLVFEMDRCDMSLTDAINQGLFERYEVCASNQRACTDDHINEVLDSNDKNQFYQNDTLDSNNTLNDKSYVCSSELDDAVLNTLFPSGNTNDSSSFVLADPFTDENVEYNTSHILTDDSSSEQSFEQMDESQLEDIRTDAPKWVLRMMHQITSSLSYVHKKGIIHMDVKPDNILIKVTDGEIVFQLCDFNISRFKEGSVDLDGDKVYMAPEILKNRCFYKSDVFSLGLVYLSLLNGEDLPTTGAEYSKLRKNDFSGWKIDKACRRMLERNHSLRWSSEELEKYFKSFV